MYERTVEWMDGRTDKGEKVAQIGEWIVRYAKRYWNGWIEE